MECPALGTSDEIIAPKSAKSALSSLQIFLCRLDHSLPTNLPVPGEPQPPYKSSCAGWTTASPQLPHNANKAAETAALSMNSCMMALYSLYCFLGALLDAGSAVCALFLIDRCNIVLNCDCAGRTVLFADMTCDTSALAIAVDEFTHIL